MICLELVREKYTYLSIGGNGSDVNVKRHAANIHNIEAFMIQLRRCLLFPLGTIRLVYKLNKKYVLYSFLQRASRQTDEILTEWNSLTNGKIHTHTQRRSHPYKSTGGQTKEEATDIGQTSIKDV